MGKPQPPIFFQFISETILALFNHFWLPGFLDPKDQQSLVGNGSGSIYHVGNNRVASSGCSKYHRDEHFNREKWWNYQVTSRSSGSSGTAWLWDLETVWSSGCWDVKRYLRCQRYQNVQHVIFEILYVSSWALFFFLVNASQFAFLLGFMAEFNLRSRHTLLHIQVHQTQKTLVKTEFFLNMATSIFFC